MLAVLDLVLRGQGERAAPMMLGLSPDDQERLATACTRIAAALGAPRPTKEGE